MRVRLAAGWVISFAALFGMECVTQAAPRSASSSKSKAPALSRSSSTMIPGTGTCIDYASDDFEEDGWEFIHRHPKSSREQDEATRSPMGYSSNSRWHEGPERGQPDQIEVVTTPPGGLEGSERSLLMRTLNSGIPGYRSNDVQQDDLISNSISRLRGGIPVGERPSVTVRVYLPPAEQWEKRSGPHFGFRTSASTLTTGKTSGLFSISRENEVEPYWPGMWIHFRSTATRGVEKDSAYIAVRSNRMGHDFPAKEITEFGWWTLGMSYTPDGMVHYYASPGVDELTAADYLTSQYPYGFQARQFRTYFFDVCNRNDGRSWSTPFVIDDPKLYVVDARRVNSIVEQKLASEARMAEQQRLREQRLAEQREAREARAAEMSSRPKQTPQRSASRRGSRSRTR
jgi:hypothetical protein